MPTFSKGAPRQSAHSVMCSVPQSAPSCVTKQFRSTTSGCVVCRSAACVYLTEIQLSPQQNYRDLRSAYFVSYGALDFIERFSNGAAPMPPRGTILLTVRPVMYVTERGFALRVN